MSAQFEELAGELGELLAGLTLDELAERHGAGSPEVQAAIAAECDRRDKMDARPPKRRTVSYSTGERAGWYEAAHAQWLQAEAACNGVLLNKRGIAAGLDPMASLWSGPWHVARAYASEELLEFWESHPRVTVSEFLRQGRHERACERQERERAMDELRAPRAASYADTVPVAQEWLLEGKIPAGEVTLLAGPGSVGKGLLCAGLAAAVTRGGLQVDGSQAGPSGDVVLVTPEDDAASAVVHRLTAAGAELGKCHDATELDGGPFLLPGSLPALRAMLGDLPGTRLIVIDPLLACSTVSLAANVTVRQKIMLPLQQLARDYGIAVVLVHHTTKAGVVASSKGLTDAARSVLTVQLDKSRPEVRVLTVDKTNIATASQSPLRFTIAGGYPDTRAVFASAPDGALSAAQEAPGAMPPPERLEEVRLWLEGNGPAAASAVCAGTKLPYPVVRTALTVLHTARMAELAPGGGWQIATKRQERVA